MFRFLAICSILAGHPSVAILLILISLYIDFMAEMNNES